MASFSDYCLESGNLNGFNCLSEMYCVPMEYVCDGIPDCVSVDTSLEELTGCGNSASIHKPCQKLHVLNC